MLELIAASLLLAAEPAAPESAPPPAAATAPETAAAPAASAEAAEVPASPAEAAQAPVAAPAAGGPAPEASAPPQHGSPAVGGMRPMLVTVSLALARSYPGGSVAAHQPMNDLTSPMGTVRLDAGIRLRPKLMLALVLDMSGGGTPGATWREQCSAVGVDCTVASSRVALDARYVFTPFARTTWWAGAGLGVEGTELRNEDSRVKEAFMPNYNGGLFPRLSAGWDSRVNPYFGWGFYGGISFGTFTQVAMGESTDWRRIPGDEAGHTWLDLGVRIIAFP
ncbi:MAG TPA: hypothetical protein VLT61_04085 [Anaeromyxobacteraceae bacterium]|nr:hypothetical protein [Anaeromyxobacteraceae bacterium]